MTSPLWKLWIFPIKKGEREVSIIEKKWSGFSKAILRRVFKSRRKNKGFSKKLFAAKELFTDANSFRVRFTDAKLTADEKLLLLASAVFVDILYTADEKLLLLAVAVPEAFILFHAIEFMK